MPSPVVFLTGLHASLLPTRQPDTVLKAFIHLQCVFVYSHLCTFVFVYLCISMALHASLTRDQAPSCLYKVPEKFRQFRLNKNLHDSPVLFARWAMTIKLAIFGIFVILSNLSSTLHLCMPSQPAQIWH